MITEIFLAVSGRLGVEWAPRDVPLSRRLQTLAAASWVALVLLGEVLAVLLFLTLLYSNAWIVALLYSAWMLNDIDVCNRGGRKSECVRGWVWWRYYRDYFPLQLVRTVELDPGRNYLFGVFPHGVIACGAFGAFCTNALGFKELFPGLEARMITLRGHFLVPLFRELALALGLCSSSRESISNLLDKAHGTGRCVCLMVGGAAEALHAHPGQHSVLLNKRKGFVRLAIMSGAPLVPVFTFGEADVYRPLSNPEDSWIRWAQETFKSWTGVSPVLPLGRGLFQYSVGLLPHRTPITTVVGAPLDVVRNPDPSPEEVDAVHAAFSQALQQLFDTHKHKYLPDAENAKLVIS